MRCPRCGSDKKQLIQDTRQQEKASVVRRRRRCGSCAAHYVTVEQWSEQSLRVLKSDGREAPFQRDAVARSIRRASIRKYQDEDLASIVTAVFADAHAHAKEGVVTSQEVGKAVLRQLKKIDAAAHIRYALVFLGRVDRDDDRGGWVDADDVRAWLREEYPDLSHWSPPARLVSVVKRSGKRQEFAREKLEKSIGRAAKGRETRTRIHDLATRITDDVIRELDVQPVVTSGQIAAEVLRTLRHYDQIAYLRYASATKNYPGEEAFEAEALLVRNFQIRQRSRSPE